MTNDEPLFSSRPMARRTSKFSLATLFCVLTVSAILIAWFVDHRRLAAQIQPAQQKLMVAHRLSNASGDLVVQKLTSLFESRSIVYDPTTNMVLIWADKINQDRILMMLQYMDQPGTDVVESKTRASKLESNQPEIQIE